MISPDSGVYAVRVAQGEFGEADDGVGDGVEPRGWEVVEVVLSPLQFGVDNRLCGDRAEPVGEGAGLLVQDERIERAVDDQERRGVGVDAVLR
jgi:hypothetical protein